MKITYELDLTDVGDSLMNTFIQALRLATNEQRQKIILSLQRMKLL